ncbi:hypothetical protein BIW11_07945 [Tropilaelaps mercedesae]|uniref:Uncharacterized protein n=1 Tax=Tropilaelaps mercedesae TaxID=418985 RepID=A0A1V9XRX2_9ACAR|nr:hypothetical protein BIW11_07945 [Tropilaelaps mercedesae]
MSGKFKRLFDTGLAHSIDPIATSSPPDWVSHQCAPQLHVPRGFALTSGIGLSGVRILFLPRRSAAAQMLHLRHFCASAMRMWPGGAGFCRPRRQGALAVFMAASSFRVAQRVAANIILLPAGGSVASLFHRRIPMVVGLGVFRDAECRGSRRRRLENSGRPERLPFRYY